MILCESPVFYIIIQLIFLCLVANIFGFMFNDRVVTISTSDGDVMGLRKHILGNVVYAFLGIPFAQPPIGKLRFQNPRPVQRWKGIYSATKLPKTCFQSQPEQFELNNPALRMWINNTEMSEDCLYLNIWTPKLKPLSNQKRSNDFDSNSAFNDNKNPFDILPTMVWIHGDSFTSGSSTLDVYNGEILASRMNVIVISIQYRLGPLGFLFLDPKEVPGNQGLMDQVLALKWINKNIERFGGNPKYITIFGSHSGATSAALHLISPMTKSLFNQAIMQSATSLNWWSHESPTQALINTHNLASISGCKENMSYTHLSSLNSGNVEEELECLRSLEPATLVGNQWKIAITYRSGFSRKNYLKRHYHSRYHSMINKMGDYFFDFPFKPVIGTEYLPQSPGYYLTKGASEVQKRRVMLGINANEGLIHLIKGMRYIFLPNNSLAIGEHPPHIFNHYNMKKVDPIDMLAFTLLAEPYMQQFLMQAVAFEYQLPTNFFNVREWFSQEVVEKFNEIIGDYNFKCPVIDFADLYFRQSEVHLYSFEHRTKNLPLPPWTGVMHGQEIPYIFGKPYDTAFQRNYYNFTDAERDLSHKIMKFWTNFAQTGHPNYRLKEFNTHQAKNQWESYNVNVIPNKDRSHIVFFNNTVHMSRNLRRHQCLFWRHLMPQIRLQIMTKSNCPERTKYMQDKLKPTPVKQDNKPSQKSTKHESTKKRENDFQNNREIPVSNNNNKNSPSAKKSKQYDNKKSTVLLEIDTYLILLSISTMIGLHHEELGWFY